MYGQYLPNPIPLPVKFELTGGFFNILYHYH